MIYRRGKKKSIYLYVVIWVLDIFILWLWDKMSLFRNLNTPIDSLILHELWHWWCFLVDCYPIRTDHSHKENGSVLAHLPCSSCLSDLPLPQSLSVAEDGPFQLWNMQPRSLLSYVILLNSFLKKTSNQQWHVIVQICSVTYEKTFRNNKKTS